jgi:hypothetical protein
MMTAYLSEVLPFARLLDRSCVSADFKSFVWADRNGVWDTQRITKVLAQETAIRLGHRITFQDYRHIAIAIDREHVRGLIGDANDEPDDVYDLGASHSSRTADQVYGIDATMLRGLNPRTVNAFRDVVGRWHRFLNFEDEEEDTTIARKRALNPSQGWTLPSRKRPCLAGDGETLDLLKRGLESLLGPDAKFRSKEQKEALIAIVSKRGPLVVILPTGGGKSLLFQLPASLSGARTTVVVVPFRSLIADLVQRCTLLGIGCVEWIIGRPQHAQLTLVVAETAVSTSFLSFVSDLRIAGNLDRIVIDECHVIFTADGYRPRLPDLDRLRAIPCQFVFLTGTLPPCLEENLESAMLLRNDEGLGYIRASTDRPAIAYRVETCGSGQVQTRVGKIIAAARQSLSVVERIIVFCRTRRECERMAEVLVCEPYHSKWDANDESMASWIDGRS